MRVCLPAERRDALLDLLDWLHEHKGPLMILDAYVDESAREAAEEPLAVAGYLFKKTHYRQFARAWKGVLRLARVDALHMTDLYAGGRAFRGMSLARRSEILSAAVDAIREHALCACGVLLSVAEFRELAPAWWAQAFGSAYSLGCQALLQRTALWLKDHGRGADRVIYTFEAGHKFQAEADALLHGIARDASMKDYVRYEGHAFLSKGCAGLQAADIFAWLLTKMLDDRFMSETAARAFAGPILRLVSETDRCAVMKPSGEVLVQMIREQLKGKGHFTVDAPPHKRTLK